MPDDAKEQKLDRLLRLPKVKKAFARETKLDRSHRIPLLAGYSKDGRTIYIDTSMPASFKYDGREVKTDRYLIVHEELEKALIDALGWAYGPAHEMALIAERRAVERAGIAWKAYDEFMQGNIRRTRAQAVRDVPTDLDLTPYRAERALLRQIREARPG